MRFFIADDDRAIRSILKQMIEDEDLGEVVGEAEDGSQIEGHYELDQGHPVGGLFAREQILKKEFYNYTHFYMKTEEGIENRDLHIKPKGLYAVGYQIGDEAEAAYRSIMQFIEEYGLEMGDYAYEEYMLDEVVADGFDNQITRIQLQVRNR